MNALTETVPEKTEQSREACFTELVERQSRFVFKVAWAILRNAQDAEDIVQETFLKLYRNKSWERIQDERAFLARTSWRLAVDRLAVNKMAVDRMRRGRAMQFEPPGASATPEQAVIAANRTAAVHRFLDGLPEELRQPLALSAIDELTSPEISALMGIPEGTVRTRIMRARQILKHKLTAWMGDKSMGDNDDRRP